jgi:hypothetical protein
MYTNPRSVRQLVSLFQSTGNTINLRNITDGIIRNAINQSDSKVNSLLASRYIVTIEVIDEFKLTGTVTTTPASTDDDPIDGTNNTEVFPNDMVYIMGTREALKVKSVTDDTNLITDSNSIYQATDSKFFIIPQSIVTVSEWYAAQILLLAYKSDISYQQEVMPLFNEYSKIVKPIIDELTNGRFYNTELKPQASAKTLSRFVKITQNTSDSEYIERVKSYRY